MLHMHESLSLFDAHTHTRRYTGLEGYNQTIVGFLTWLLLYSAQIVSFLAMLLSLLTDVDDTKSVRQRILQSMLYRFTYAIRDD
jgi:hypothetical protein